MALENLLKVTAKLRTIVSLYHCKLKAKLHPSMQDNLGCQPRQYTRVNFGISHPAVDVNDGIDIQPTFGGWTDVVNSICFNQLTWAYNMRASGVVSSNPLFSTVNLMVAFQYASYAT